MITPAPCNTDIAYMMTKVVHRKGTLAQRRIYLKN